MKKKLEMLLSVVLVLGIVFLGFIAYGSINNRWYKIINVTSGSMSPIFEEKDLIVVFKTTPDKVKVGDIVTFSVGNNLDTHRVVEIRGNEFITKGDANEFADEWDTIKIVPAAKYIFRIQKLGYLMSFLRKTASPLVDRKSSSIIIRAANPTPKPILESKKVTTPTSITESEKPNNSEPN